MRFFYLTETQRTDAKGMQTSRKIGNTKIVTRNFYSATLISRFTSVRGLLITLALIVYDALSTILVRQQARESKTNLKSWNTETRMKIK